MTTPLIGVRTSMNYRSRVRDFFSDRYNRAARPFTGRLISAGGASDADELSGRVAVGVAFDVLATNGVVQGR